VSITLVTDLLLVVCDEMNTTRDEFLQRVRQAVAEGNRAGGSAALPERGSVGYQGAGADSVTRFRDEFAAAGGQTHLVRDRAGAAAVVLDLVRARSVRRVVMGGGDVLAELQVVEPLHAVGVEVVETGTQETNRDTFFAADLGLTGVDYLIAETGSVILASRTEQPRSLSLLPPIHVAVAQRRQVLPDLFDLFALLGKGLDELPACLSIITGPSKTGDIELRLVTGVHGPGECHVILIDPQAGLS
jgi:L-lactate utilization protein LutC